MNPKSSLPEDRKPENRELSFVPGGMVSVMNDLHKLQDTIDRLTAENNDLKDKIRNLGVDYDYAKNAASKSNDEVRSAKTQLEAKTTALIEALSKLDAANATVSRLNTTIQNEEWRVTRSLKSAEDEAKRLESNNEHSKSVIDQLTKTLAFANKRLQEAKNNENHLAQKTILLYNENQKINDQISKLTKQIEELQTTSSYTNNIPLTPDGITDLNKIKPEAILQFINILKKELLNFNNKPLYKRFLEAPNFLKNIYPFVINLSQDNPNAAPPHTPNTSSSK